MINVLYKIDILDKRSKFIPLNVNDHRKYLIYKQGGVNLCGDILIKKLVSFWFIENNLPWGAGLLEGTFLYAFYAHKLKTIPGILCDHWQSTTWHTCLILKITVKYIHVKSKG